MNQTDKKAKTPNPLDLSQGDSLVLHYAFLGKIFAPSAPRVQNVREFPQTLFHSEIKICR